MKRLVVLLALVLLAGIGAPAAHAQQGAQSLVDALDEEFLVKVRQAGLWEMPAGDIAQERSTDERVKEVGRTLMADHALLDEQVRALAAQLDVRLPDEPTDAQKSWLAEMAAASGARFDAVWALRLRAAHGAVFGLVAQVRANTLNPVVREFATTANTIVLKHMTLLESTGKVDFGSVAAPTVITLASDSEGIDVVVAVALVPLVVAITIFLLWMLSHRGGRRGAVAVPEPAGGGTRRRSYAERELAR